MLALIMEAAENRIRMAIPKRIKRLLFKRR